MKQTNNSREGLVYVSPSVKVKVIRVRRVLCGSPDFGEDYYPGQEIGSNGEHDY